MRNSGLLITKYLSLTAIILLVACNNVSVEKPASTKNSKKTASIIKKEKAFTKKKNISLSDANIESFLMEYGKENKETIVLMKTPKGNMKIRLYKNTPLHRANIIRLIKSDFYKGTVFYRVVKDFVIQGGDSDDCERKDLKIKMGNYTLPSEFRSENIHKKGALSMAREYENNPKKKSVPFEFFIIQGDKYTQGELLGAEQQYSLKISSEHKGIYKTKGGCPHLDGQHTVFGQVIEGLNVIDSIANVSVDEGDWPLEDISIEFQIIK